jgi:hypothetical protein
VYRLRNSKSGQGPKGCRARERERERGKKLVWPPLAPHLTIMESSPLTGIYLRRKLPSILIKTKRDVAGVLITLYTHISEVLSSNISLDTS